MHIVIVAIPTIPTLKLRSVQSISKRTFGSYILTYTHSQLSHACRLPLMLAFCKFAPQTIRNSEFRKSYRCLEVYLHRFVCLLWFSYAEWRLSTLHLLWNAIRLHNVTELRKANVEINRPSHICQLYGAIFFFVVVSNQIATSTKIEYNVFNE